MIPSTEKEREVWAAVEKAIQVIIGMKKSGLCPVLPEDDAECARRVRALLRCLAFEDNNGPLPDGISEEFMVDAEWQVFGRLHSANLMLPANLQRSPLV